MPGSGWAPTLRTVKFLVAPSTVRMNAGDPPSFCKTATYWADGGADADPYTRARVERDGEIPLGLGEGLRLTANEDSEGRALDPRCVYKLGPHAPPARFWTLEALDPDGFPLENAAERYVLRSSEILREPDGEFWVYISPRAHAGNWLPVGGAAAYRLALRLYDPALSGAAFGVERATAPTIVREHCG